MSKPPHKHLQAVSFLKQYRPLPPKKHPLKSN